MITDNPKFKEEKNQYFELNNHFIGDKPPLGSLYDAGAKAAEKILDTIAIEFAEWVSKEGWSKGSISGKWRKPVIITEKDAMGLTDNELLEIFKQNEKRKTTM
jgi:hypothetical protein